MQNYSVSDRPLRYYFPGKSPGQPYKADKGRICYQITKPIGAQANIMGDKLDRFLSKADQQINYYDSMLRETNPYNPHGKLVEFQLNIVTDEHIVEMRDKLREDVGVKMD